MPGDTIEIDLADIPNAVIIPDAPANPKSVPAAMAILDALRSGGGDPQSVMMNALAGQTGMPPEVGMLMKMFAGDSGGNSAALRDDIREEIKAEQAEVFAELSGLAERLLGENQRAREVLDAIAAGLGACPVCFGDDILCETCHGAGRPGSRLPQPEEFNRFVSPACQRVQRELRAAPEPRPWPRPSSPHYTDLGPN